jgi:predicted dehydrogenase
MSQIKLGVIGYGRRIRHIAKLACELCPDATVTAITDIRPDAVKAVLPEHGLDADRIRFFDDPDEMLDSVELDGVLVGTRCDLHTQMALKVMRRNLPLFLEKPIATSIEELASLREAFADYRSQVVVSFPLRVSSLVRTVREIVDSGKIGRIDHVQAYNNVPYGAVYFQDWYRDEAVTQGLFLQKATHDFDYINSLLNDVPTWITAMTSKQVFRGDKRPGLQCRDCSEKKTCLQSPFNPNTELDNDWIDPETRMCAFGVDTGNEDSGSALIQYESGMHVSYSQNFVTRKSAAKRGATLVGYLGTIEFDWFTDTIKVIMHHSSRVETIEMQSAGKAHGGGDTVLAENFIKVIRDDALSVAPLTTGLMSALMCLKAKESAATRTFQQIVFPPSADIPQVVRRVNGVVLSRGNGKAAQEAHELYAEDLNGTTR